MRGDFYFCEDAWLVFAEFEVAVGAKYSELLSLRHVVSVVRFVKLLLCVT